MDMHKIEDHNGDQLEYKFSIILFLPNGKIYSYVAWYTADGGTSNNGALKSLAGAV